jgi:hypothetical protein
MSDEDPVDGGLLWACTQFADVEDFARCDCDCSIDLDDETHVALLDIFLKAASDQLCLLSGHEINGGCESTETFCRSYCSCGSTCTCGWDTILLGAIPVISVSDVAFEDYVFDPDDFVIVDDVGIAWASGVDHRWPGAKNVEITYRWGHVVDEITKQATIELACAAIRSCLSDKRNTVTADSVNRQGISFGRRATSTTASIAERAAADFPWMSRFLATYNPTRAIRGPVIWSPDQDQGHFVRALS